ncbi:WecB/TagA/CpsF family glycosyltransferase [Mesorhizobium sp. IMUNJ 23232]|uniref:WecB/TagA/CpsF family glycosyltransferase n=1 Tax=Mesorhizobium sp. IMUNJ 23232 TaxID=3376064 RepID=UPI0037908F22
MTSTIDYLGFRLLDADLSGVRAALSEELSGSSYGYVVTPNVDHVVSYHRGGNPELVAAYDRARFQICDSRILAILARLSNRRLKPCPGSDLTESLLRKPLANGRRIAVIGPGLADFEVLRQGFPDASLSHIESAARLVVGSAEWHETVSRARDAEWDLLLICLSFPKQEFFALELARQGRQSGLALCVGASVDFLTGRQTRAPSIMRRTGLEWLYRLASDPKRMVDRYLVRGPAIFPIVANDLFNPLPPAPPRDEGQQQTRILYLSTVLPHRLQGGGEICSMNFIEALKQAGCEVEVVAYQRSGEGNAGALPPGFHSPRPLVIESGQSRMRTGYWMLRSILHRRAFSVDKYVTRAMRSFVQACLRRSRWDLVVIDHAQAGWLLPLVPESLPVVLVAHNVEHRLYDSYGAMPSGAAPGGLRERVRSAVYRREARRLLAIESEAARRCREIWSLSESDGAELRSLAPASRVRVFGVPGQSFPEADRLPAPAVDVGLLGNWAWDVNRAGLDWFLHSVAPLLPSGLEIVVGGKSNVAPGTRQANVRFEGFVPDAGDFLRQCRVVAIPSTVGSGIQIKTIETLALGVPTVATPVAMRGIDDPPSTVRIASDAKEMATAIQEALRAERPDGSEGRRWWEQRRDRFRADIASAVEQIFSAHLPSEMPAKPSSASPVTTKSASVAAAPIKPEASLLYD